jgi:hypothetical protein
MIVSFVQGVVMGNLLPLMHKLTDEDHENIALAMRRYGPPNHALKRNYKHYLKAAAAFDIIAFSNCEEVMAALREAVPKYPEVRNTIRKLQRKCR